MEGLGRKAVALSAAVAATALLVLAPSASATFHETKVREVFSDGGAGNGDFVELQMWSAGQTEVQGRLLRIYNPDGTTALTLTFGNDVANGQNQRTILIRKAGSASPADFTLSGMDISAAGGAVCFLENVSIELDCAAWGTWTGATTPGIAAAAGAPAGALSGANSLTRSIAPGCPTLLEEGDDSDSSAADFALQAPSPRLNSVAPTEMACLATSPITMPTALPATTATPATTKKKTCKKKSKGAAAAKKKKRCRKKK